MHSNYSTLLCSLILHPKFERYIRLDNAQLLLSEESVLCLMFFLMLWKVIKVSSPVQLCKRICKATHLFKMCRSEEHTSELQSHSDLVCRLLLEKKNTTKLHAKRAR